MMSSYSEPLLKGMKDKDIISTLNIEVMLKQLNNQLAFQMKALKDSDVALRAAQLEKNIAINNHFYSDNQHVKASVDKFNEVFKKNKSILDAIEKIENEKAALEEQVQSFKSSIGKLAVYPHFWRVQKKALLADEVALLKTISCGVD